MRRVDWRLLPLLSLFYLLSFLDRTNIANAKVAGMNHDLHLTGAQYNMALTVFFFPYFRFEVQSNIVLKLVKPSLWISFLMLCWGVVMTCQGLVQSYGQLIATRVLLGFFESGFFPAASYLLTTWYCRFEVQTRLAIFFSAASAASAFSGLLAFGIQHMDGAGGYAGWRWIFILEGIFTVVAGSGLYWLPADSPQTASFLKPWEAEAINRRLEQDSGTGSGSIGTDDKFSWKTFRSAFFEWKIWVAVIVWGGNCIPLFGFTFMAPTIVHDLGYSAANAQLLTVPVYTLGVISTVVFSWLSDRRRTRWIFIVIPYTIAAVGFLGLLAVPQPRFPGSTYALLFFIPAGKYPGLIGILSWIGNNLAPSRKRAIGMGLLISIGNTGGLIGSNIFQEHQAPNYWLGYGFCSGILLAAIASTIVLKWAYERENRKREGWTEEDVRGKFTDGESADMGNKSPLYRYVV
ncbi:hypothetical protein M409DRAFT_66224 [Zasmidium cellare ATCC 36951]|uniref:Major facilitator superfamily (MFS) profile domain-containing protein n=1 Tax=Zasmidium cellare ATCC 36951 TaxID=1080233 RepID=A0A6A6CM04_ZASCE|nr:uncharacterized protein M409DRAFT_66224 [Zasmidium cellare ATCC 36951]KAF2167190.1 hypothetical protein M409DRAFT_66224 [Zasmidium cellare ATCC 36951]